MFFEIRGLLPPEAADDVVRELAAAPFADGKTTAQGAARDAKNNLQLEPAHPVARRLGEGVLAAVAKSDAFKSIAIPHTILPLTFGLYREGMSYGEHLDQPIMPTAGRPLRTDLSMTIWLSRRASYDGGELIVRGDAGERAIKGDAGDAFLYPSTTVHRVAPVTRGERFVAVTWIQSLVRDPEQRHILQTLAGTLASLQQRGGLDADVMRLRQVQHHLMRLWADC